MGDREKEGAKIAEFVSRKETAKRLWERRYHELKEYKKIHGDTNVPRRFEPNPQLGVWVSNQRQYYKKYKGGVSGWGMTDTRINRLEKIGFEWVLSGGRNHHHFIAKVNQITEAEEHEWDRMYEKLVEYSRLYGDVNVPKKYDEDQALARWVQNQRKEFRRYKGGIKSKYVTKERYLLLLEVGFQHAVDADDDDSIRNFDNDADNNDNSSSRPFPFDNCSDVGDSELSEVNDLDMESQRGDEDNKMELSRNRSIPLKYGGGVSKFAPATEKKNYKLSKHLMQKDKIESGYEEEEEDDDKDFYEAVHFCGDDANLDSIAEVVFNKYAVMKTKPPATAYKCI